ncbi:MAG: 2,3-bisphosphoglycerate-dependent phosphoglycerate mutase [Lactobacillus sp.]|nr:2,3-bisphosphoglycerate-dependent phosphoglycerate mutase [Lactobacillus sp.]
MTKLILVRHGESQANKDNVFTGWNDVPLTSLGRKQAQTAGKIIAALDFKPTCVHTSVLSRAIVTANIIAEMGNFLWTPMQKTWRLNERHYGALRGMNKDASKNIYGEAQIKAWRRGFDAVPPLTEPNRSRRYQGIDPHLLPGAESLHQTMDRLLPYFYDQVCPKLMNGEDQLIVAHGSTIRALIKYLERISDEGIVSVEVPNAEPIVYEFDQKLKIIAKRVL